LPTRPKQVSEHRSPVSGRPGGRRKPPSRPGARSRGVRLVVGLHPAFLPALGGVVVSGACRLCGRGLPPRRVAVCKKCAAPAEPPAWDSLPHTVFVSRRDAKLLKRNGTLKPDPQYGTSVSRPKTGGGKPPDNHGITFSGTSQREELARWLAWCGLSAREIALALGAENPEPTRNSEPTRKRRGGAGVVETRTEERDGREFTVRVYQDVPPPEPASRSHTVTTAMVRRWAGRELAEYKLFREAALQHDLVRQVKTMRVQDLGRWRPEMAQLWLDYRRDRLPWQRIVLEECVSHIDGLRAKAHPNTCEACDQLFLATRRDARVCSPKCRKWLNHEKSSHKRGVSFLASLGREGGYKVTGAEVLGRLDRMESRIGESLNRLQQTLDVVADRFDDDQVDDQVERIRRIINRPNNKAETP
jgi:hypothetical protein